MSVTSVSSTTPYVDDDVIEKIYPEIVEVRDWSLDPIIPLANAAMATSVALLVGPLVTALPFVVGAAGLGVLGSAATLASGKAAREALPVGLPAIAGGAALPCGMGVVLLSSSPVTGIAVGIISVSAGLITFCMGAANAHQIHKRQLEEQIQADLKKQQEEKERLLREQAAFSGGTGSRSSVPLL